MGTRLAYKTPDWENLVHLAVTDIRQFGGTSITLQILAKEGGAICRQS